MKWIPASLLVFLFSCGGKSEKVEEKVAKSTSSNSTVITQVKEESSSKLTFPLDFPINDLYKAVNRALPPVLVEDTLKLKKKGDYITLKIEPIGKALLASYGNNLDVSIPMKVTAEVEKKVLGIKVHKPISLKVRVDMNTKLSIDEDWNLNAACRIQKLHWIEPPVIEILGIKVNLQNKVEKKLNEKSATIEQTVCTALQELVPLRQQVTKIWALLGNTHRVGKKPIDIWLTSKASVFSGHFTKNVKDTLRVIIHTESDLFITPVSGLEYESQPMPKNAFADLESENDLDINVDIYLPYEKVNELLRAKLDSMTFSYEGYSILLTNFITNTAHHKLHLKFDIVGDIDATVDAYAYPVLGADKSLIVDSIEYDITSESTLVNLAEWVAGDELTEFLKSKASIPLAHILDSLDNKIVGALNNSKVGGKVGLEMSFTSLASDTIVFTGDGLQWFFNVRGNAHAYLTDQLIQ
ncbi:MAG: DUF4403 family protein [Ekhidna sp.]|nr:DUF4403 family protein [Ekhidna sp.]